MRQSEIFPNSPDEGPDETSQDALRLLLLIETVGQLEERTRATQAELETLNRSVAMQYDQMVALLEAQTASSRAIVPEIEQRLVALTERTSAAMLALLPQVEQRLQLAVTLSETVSSAERTALGELTDQLTTSLERLETATSALGSTRSSRAEDSVVDPQEWSRFRSEQRQVLEELPKLALLMPKLEWGIERTRLELLLAFSSSSPRSAAVEAPASDTAMSVALKAELKQQWRKLEAFVMGDKLDQQIVGKLRASLQAELTSLRAQIREDLKAELATPTKSTLSPEGIGAVVRDAVGTAFKRATPSPPPPPSERAPMPLVGVVILASVTTIGVNAAFQWLV